MGVVEIYSEKELNEILENSNDHGKEYVFIDFWAPWCSPCKNIAPVINEFSEKYNDNIFFASVDIDKVQELGSKYNIKCLPTFKTFQVGTTDVEFEDILGASKEPIENRLKFLNNGVELDEDF